MDKFNSKEDIIEYINDLNLDDNKLYKIILTGKRSFEINEREIIKLITNLNVLKIKNKTTLNYDLDKLKEENTLKGIFVKEVLEKLNSGEYSKEEIDKAIEIGISNM